MRFRALLLEAIKAFAETGYTSEADLLEWLQRLRAALERELPGDAETRKEIARTLEAIFKRDVDRNGVQRRVPGVDRYTLARIAPQLRAELDRRIFASVDLIKLNKAAATQKTLQRFSGWVSSVPPGGTIANVREIAAEVLKPSKQLKFERRRLAIDQGHKLSAAIASVVAIGQGAIAAIWHDRGQYDRGYDARPEHLARSGKLFLVRDSWAMQEGLVKKGGLAYTDEIEQPAQEIFCSCWYEYVTAPRDLPPDLLTEKGRAWLAGVRHDSIPTPAQIIAGNYPKGHYTIAGLEITIETPKNALRRGVGSDGKPWVVPMPADYGYIRGVMGADGEHLDCYVGPNPDAPLVWTISQLALPARTFDEHKVMIGFNSREEALSTYELGFSDGMGAERIGEVLEQTMPAFKKHGVYR